MGLGEELLECNALLSHLKSWAEGIMEKCLYCLNVIVLYNLDSLNEHITRTVIVVAHNVSHSKDSL